MTTSSPGHDHHSPSARKPAIHRSLLPTITAPAVRGQSAMSARMGQVQAFGRHRTIVPTIATIGKIHHRMAGKAMNGVNR